MIDFRRIGLWVLIALTLVGVYFAMHTVEQRGHAARPAIEAAVPETSDETTVSSPTTAPAQMRATPASPTP